MIRKALGIFRKVVIVVLTLGAVATGSIALTSQWLGAYVCRKPSPNIWLNFELSTGWLCIELLHSKDAQWLAGWDAKANVCDPKSLRGYLVSWYGDPIWGTGGVGIPGTWQSRQCITLFGCFLAFAIYPTLAFIRGPLRRWRRRRKGLCLTCGYDLTGNVSGVCPECGWKLHRAHKRFVRKRGTGMQNQTSQPPPTAHGGEAP